MENKEKLRSGYEFFPTNFQNQVVKKVAKLSWNVSCEKFRFQ